MCSIFDFVGMLRASFFDSSSYKSLFHAFGLVSSAVVHLTSNVCFNHIFICERSLRISKEIPTIVREKVTGWMAWFQPALCYREWCTDRMLRNRCFLGIPFMVKNSVEWSISLVMWYQRDPSDCSYDGLLRRMFFF